VSALTLTGLGERSHLLDRRINLETHIADVVNTLIWNELSDVVLVGHSYGGMVITGAADRAAARIRSLVYLDAFLPCDGESMLDIMAPDRRRQVLELAHAKGDGWKLPWIDSPAFTVDDPAEQSHIAGLMTPLPLGTLEQRLSLTGAWQQIPKLNYILAKRYDPSPMHGFAARCRQDPRWNVREIDAHHMLPLLKPQEVVAHLLKAI
jgi:pimeloyl-ACP methyl ester carboxylesterase